jgi:hypothetical protein
VQEHDPEIVGVSYRLTPKVAKTLLCELHRELGENNLLGRRFFFGGTPPVCEVAEELGWFEKCFSGLEPSDEVARLLRGDAGAREDEHYGSSLFERIAKKAPYPILRHHFGLPSLDETIDGARHIAESGVLDVISIAPDQNAQESFFRPDEMKHALDGAGGVPVRTAKHLRAIYQTTRTGNYPLVRIYSGTRDLLQWAQLSSDTVHNAWAAVPLCWYSALDGRSTRPLEQAIMENQQCMRWHGEAGIPLEVNEPHHWSLRGAHDTISVVMAYLAAYNARAMGVERYVGQYMFNTPPGLSPENDLAKALAQAEMVESLHGPDFVSLRQVRAGLLHLSPKANVAKGQLAASTMLSLAIRPHIIHVVGFCEGDHAASAEDVIESCEIVHGVLKNCHGGLPDVACDPLLEARKQELLRDAESLLGAIRSLAAPDEDAFVSPRVIAKAVAQGIIDAPHLAGNPAAAGRLKTRLVDGTVRPTDPGTGEAVSEEQRLGSVLAHPEPLRATSIAGGAV